MQAMKANIVIFCAVLIFQGSFARAPEPEENAEINVEYATQNTGQGPTETFWINVPSGKSSSPSISLRVFDSEEREWVEESVTYNPPTCSCYNVQCSCTATLERPLLGYDLLKPSVCGEEEMKTQPFQEGRWGFVEDEEEGSPCYLIMTSSGGKSYARMVPDNCIPEERPQGNYPDERILPPKNSAPYREKESPRNYHEAGEKFTPNRSPRNVGDTSITFTKSKLKGGMRKFVCRVSYQHNGAPLNLNNGIPSHDVKIYYKNGASWGHLLTPGWDQFNAGTNRFRSIVSKQHLNQQGVQWNGCFKCEATVNGNRHKTCLGSCTC